MEQRINPYVAGAPVTDQRMFFGREDVFSWIEQNIGGQFSDNMLVIHGQRRVGKTSVLKQLGNRLPDNYIPVFFDFQGRTNTTINKFLYRLAREITRTIEREHGLDCPRVNKEGFDNDPEYFAGEYLTEIKEVLGDKNLVLVFDEFDTLEERTARDMLGQYLVPLFQPDDAWSGSIEFYLFDWFQWAQTGRHAGRVYRFLPFGAVQEDQFSGCRECQKIDRRTCCRCAGVFTRSYRSDR